MKSFRQFLEAARPQYHDWGFIHPDGRIFSGAKDSSDDHYDFLKKFHSSQSNEEKKKHPIKHYAEWADEIGRGTFIRTNNNEHSVGGAIKALATLPSSTGKYHLDHITAPDLEGNSRTIRKYLNYIHGKYTNKAVPVSAKQLIAAEETILEGRYKYHDWGIIHPSGEIISGEGSNEDFSHEELLDDHFNHEVSSKDRKENPRDHYAQYFDEHKNGLTLRTYQTAGSVATALKGLKSLPSSTGEYHHEHLYEPYNYAHGKESQIRRHLQNEHKRLSEPDVVKEETRTLYRDWGIIHPSGKIISGYAKPRIYTHDNLKDQVYAGLSAAEKKKHPMRHYAEYFDDVGTSSRPGQGMTFRTKGNKHSIEAALHGLKTLPSSTGEYHHEHMHKTISSGSDKIVRRHLYNLKKKAADN